MLNILVPLPFRNGLYLVLVFCNLRAQDNNCDSCIIYSPQQMEEHKNKCKEQMRSNNSKNLQDHTYQLQRALKAVSGVDTDYIPKVIGAGEIFYDSLNPYQLMHNGVKIHLHSYYGAQWLTDVIYGLKGHHESQEEKCFYEVLKYIPDNAIMIELGAYWAYYSLWFNTQIKNAKNFMIEPDFQRLETGRRNFALNNRNGTFIQGFAGVMKDNEPNIQGAQCISIDEFIESQKITRINILHADIQGAEQDMLKSIIKYFDKIDYLFISTHEPVVNQKEIIEFFETHNCIILAEHNGPESFSGDGLIVAKRKGVAGPEKIEIGKFCSV